MRFAARYWTLIRLDASGKRRAQTMSIVQAFFQQQFGDRQISDLDVQTCLMSIVHCATNELTSRLALLCLRCYLSHHIVSACADLTQRFGDRYHFTLSNLLPFVLDDQGRNPAEFSRTFAYSILQSFDPEKSSLATWTTRLVRQHRELDKFLIQQGLYRLSDWAILNDTTVSQLRRILVQVYELSSIEVQQAYILLESYHTVYSASSNRCFAPTIKQLEVIAQRMQIQGAKSIAPKEALNQLQHLAKRLRQYRIAVRGGTTLHQSMTESNRAAFEKKDFDAFDDEAQFRFLQLYRRELIVGLDAALTIAIQARIQTMNWQYDRPCPLPTPCAESDRFLQMLYLLYVRNLTMREIALQMGLSAQYQVTRFLRLKQLRLEVHQHLMNHLTDRVMDVVMLHDGLSSNQIEAALNDQIECLLQHDVDQLQTAIKHRHTRLLLQPSLFAQRISVLLNQPLFDRYIERAPVQLSA